MLDPYYMKGVEKYVDNAHYIVWKFPASPDAYEKQARPLVYSYSLMTRAYGTCFNDENFIDYFTAEGFDVYLVDWGTTELFSLSGWTLDDISEVMEHQVIRPLLAEYGVEKLNLFCVCIGGAILSYMLQKKPELGNLIHRMAYYGVPIFGQRDLGMEKTFQKLYKAVSPWQQFWPVKNGGFSLFFLDMLLLNSGSLSMLQWSWEEFFKERQNGSFLNTIFWTYDDRWVPVPALMQIMGNAFGDGSGGDKEAETYHHFRTEVDTGEIHFLNIVGDSDMLVKPSASIVDYQSAFPKRFKTFQQMILRTGHFMFAEPGMNSTKEQISRWFAGYGINDLCYKIDKADKRFAARAEEIFHASVDTFFETATDEEKDALVERINSLLAAESPVTEKRELANRLSASVSTNESPEFLDLLNREIAPLLWHADRR